MVAVSSGRTGRHTRTGPWSGGRVEAVGLGVQGSGGLLGPGTAQAQEGVYGVLGFAVLLGGCFGFAGADAEQVVASPKRPSLAQSVEATPTPTMEM